MYANALIDRTGINGEGDVRDAVKKLEIYFCLDVGDYVFHKSWGWDKSAPLTLTVKRWS